MSSKHTTFVPFGNTHAWCVVCIVLFALVTGPLWVPLLITVDTAYRTIPAKMGRFTFQADVFAGQSEYDFVFLGSSGTWTAIDHQSLSRKWEQLYGYSTKSITLGHNWVGEELKYLQLVELFKRNKVKWIVLSLPSAHYVPHPAAKYIWNVWEDEGFFWNLPTDIKIKAYAEQVMITPRLIYAGLVGNKPLLNDSAVGRNHGSLLQNYGYSLRGQKTLPFQEDINIDGVNLYKQGFVFPADMGEPGPNARKGKPFSKIAALYYGRMRKLAQKNGAGVIYLDYPFATRNHSTVVVPFDENNRTTFTIALPTAKLFSNRANDDWVNYFKNYSHLNSRGAKYFTNTIAPLLYEAIEYSSDPKVR